MRFTSAPRSSSSRIHLKSGSNVVTFISETGIRNMRFLTCLCLFGLLPAAFAQSEAPAPIFDVADIHQSPADGGLYLHANRLEMHGVTMLHLITAAWGIPAEKVFSGPNWLDTDRFEIVAKSENPVTTQNFRPMLQALLAGRFQLKVANEDKAEQFFNLTATKRLQLKESVGPGEPQCKRANEEGYLGQVCQHAVSYTHLDVYKRQGYTHSLPGWSPCLARNRQSPTRFAGCDSSTER